MIKVTDNIGIDYEIPEELEEVFWAMDKVFASFGLMDSSLRLLPAWDSTFDDFRVKG